MMLPMGISEFATYVKHLREARGWSMEELGAAMGGMTKAQVSRVESMKSGPGIEFIIKAADAFGKSRVDMLYLAGVIDSPTFRPTDPAVREIEIMLRDLSADDVEQVVRLVRAVHQKYEK